MFTCNPDRPDMLVCSLMNAARFEHIQGLLQKTDLLGWLIYDFQGLNPLAAFVLDLPHGSHLTRRYFVWIPRQGTPVLIHNGIESGTWAHLSQDVQIEFQSCKGHLEMSQALQKCLVPEETIAMEYSPMGQIPYVSRVDAGTLEWISGLGVNVVSSAQLLQRLLLWSDLDLQEHLNAAKALVDAKDSAVSMMDHALKRGIQISEYEVQQHIQGHMDTLGLHTGHPPIVAFGKNAADPHYSPPEQGSAVLCLGMCVLIDLWAKKPGFPYADITWMAYAGQPSDAFMEAWTALTRARDGAIDFLEKNWQHGIEGWQVDRYARDILEAAGYGHAFTHRLGHNLGTDLHGPGANLDDLEIRDTRSLEPGLAFTVEPGVYLPSEGFGIRSEVDVFLGASGPRVTTPIQDAPTLLGLGDLP